MKFEITERVKHRVTGLIVLVAIAVIFLPALLEKSSRHLEENVSLSVRLPQKPPLPKVAVPTQRDVLQTVKVVALKSSPMPAPVAVVPAPQPTVIAKAESISHTRENAKTPAPIKMTQMNSVAIKKPIVNALKKEIYAVQIASFSRQANAEQLVNRLRTKGYKAIYSKSNGANGEYYKVLVGNVNERDAALHLQKQLASNLRLSGFIVKTGVS